MSARTKNHTPPTDPPTPADLYVRNVRDTPAETWKMLLRFSNITEQEQAAMRNTVDVLLQNAYSFVVATYDYLRHFPETAEILGWQTGVDEQHLAERRRFFSLWLARALSIDFGTQFGDVLFRAGKVHAAHGARHIETPSMWVTGSVGLLLGMFAQHIGNSNIESSTVALALSGWNKYLLVQLNQMQLGYEVGTALKQGTHTLDIKAYAMVRHHWGKDGVTVRFYAGETVADVLRKLLDFAPELRGIMFDPAWEPFDSEQDLWMRVKRHYQLRAGWRVQLNGKNLTFHGGFNQPVQPNDLITLFSPGR